MSGLPKGWALSKIKEAIFLNEKHIGVDDSTECGFVPMALVPTRYGDAIEFEKRNWERCKKGYTQFQDNDVILAKITPCFENGKSALVTGLPNGIGAGSTEYFVLRSVGNLVHSKYLHAFVKTKDFLINCETNMSGSVGHRRVPKDYLLDYPFPLAPLAEQKRIVEKLDEVLAQVDTIKARLDGIPDLLKRFRQSVLASAVSGRLTKSNQFPHGVDRVNRKLKDILDITSGIAFKKSQYSIEGSRLLQIANVSYGSTRWDKESYISLELAREYENFNLAQGDVVMALNRPITNGILKVAQIEKHDLPATLYQRVARMRVKENGNSTLMMSYLFLNLRSSEFREQVEKNLKGSDQPYLNTSTLADLSISICSLEEQKEIVRLVDQYFAFADTIEAQVKKAQQRVDNLTQSILAKAFRGELVPQDPNDEPADKLLERIAKARVEAEALAKAAKKAETAKKRAAKA